ncbi:MAG: hypothetical protein B1H08_01405 [Candidatus Omnitrophica bacterium 4484_171]|nr:MAG: hypothetical protein B1H08_01405 [Candidatus Omnitrophica bacterium 4484_171]
MAEDTNNTSNTEVKEDKKSSEGFKTVMKIAIGVILVILGVWAVFGWWSFLWDVIKGCIGLFLILAGVITIAIAKE